ncbi:MAG: nucleotide exchange factor GrpE [Undibacterium sp.]
MTQEVKQSAPMDEVTDEVTPAEIIEETTAPGADMVEEKSEWQLKAEEYLNDLKRVQADFENYKKRVKNDERELYGHLTAQIVTELIPVLDNFHAATGHVPADAAGSPWVTGITYIEKQFEDVLGNYGVTPLDAKPGDAFDPTRHEALDHKTTEGEGEKKLTIEKVIQKGYLIKDKLVRPAKVIVTEA